MDSCGQRKMWTIIHVDMRKRYSYRLMLTKEEKHGHELMLTWIHVQNLDKPLTTSCGLDQASESCGKDINCGFTVRGVHMSSKRKLQTWRHGIEFLFYLCGSRGFTQKWRRTTHKKKDRDAETPRVSGCN